MRQRQYTLTPATSMPTPPCGSKSISAWPTTAANAPPIPCGPSSSTPPVASSPWPLPVPPYVTPPPTPPPTMLCSLLSPPLPNYNADSTALCKTICLTPWVAAANPGHRPHALPYHGKPWHDGHEIYRSQAKSGTSHFHAYATAYVIRQGRRFTVALMSVGRNDPLAGVVQCLLRQAARAGVRPRYLLLDRGFCSVDVIRYLQSARYAWLMPLVLRGRKADHPKGPSGSRIFAGKRSGWGEYTMTSASKRRARFAVCVKCRNLRGERGRHGRQALVYAFGGPLRPSSYTWVKETYRSRFAIETSYRQMHQARIRTCTRIRCCGCCTWEWRCCCGTCGCGCIGKCCASSAWWSADRPGAFEFSQDAGVVATLDRSAWGFTMKSPRNIGCMNELGYGIMSRDHRKLLRFDCRRYALAADENASSLNIPTGSITGTDTGTSSMTVQSGDCWSMSEQGSYANGARPSRSTPLRRVTAAVSTPSRRTASARP